MPVNVIRENIIPESLRRAIYAEFQPRVILVWKRWELPLQHEYDGHFIVIFSPQQVITNTDFKFTWYQIQVGVNDQVSGQGTFCRWAYLGYRNVFGLCYPCQQHVKYIVFRGSGRRYIPGKKILHWNSRVGFHAKPSARNTGGILEYHHREI